MTGSDAQLDPSQLRAVDLARRCGVSLISGAAGSGKTFVGAALAREAEDRGLSVALCAPTGKAAKRIEDSVARVAGFRVEAKTIHRLLGAKHDGTWEYGPGNKLDVDLVIVDEMSMVDVPLAWRLLAALDLDRTRLVLVGDHHQLPPVGPGNVLRDLIARRLVPTTILAYCHRQAGILKHNCTAILTGHVESTALPAMRLPNGASPWMRIARKGMTAETAADTIVSIYAAILAHGPYAVPADVQVLVAMHKGACGTIELNRRLQAVVQERVYGRTPEPLEGPQRHARPMVGDRVIQMVNDYELGSCGIFNGTTGIVTEAADGLLVVRFEGENTETVLAEKKQIRNVELAYCLTVHKSQGSEYPCCLIAAHKSASFMTHRSWLYTACTRAQQSAIVIGDSWGINACAQKVETSRRRTILSLAEAREAGGKGDSGC